MPIEQIISITSLVFTLLSLLVTMIGWNVTARYQREILERQLQAEKEKQVQQIVFSQRLEQLNEIKKWFQEGERIWRIYKAEGGDQQPGHAQERFMEWKPNLGRIKADAKVIDNEFPPPSEHRDYGCLVLSIALLVYAFTREDVIPKPAAKPPSLESMADVFCDRIENAVLYDLSEGLNIQTTFTNAISRIDNIVTERMPTKYRG